VPRPTGARVADCREDLGIELSLILSRTGAYLHRNQAGHQHRQIELPRHCSSGAKSMRHTPVISHLWPLTALQ
jgi:hypothetical protein